MEDRISLSFALADKPASVSLDIGSVSTPSPHTVISDLAFFDSPRLLRPMTHLSSVAQSSLPFALLSIDAFLLRQLVFFTSSRASCLRG